MASSAGQADSRPEPAQNSSAEHDRLRRLFGVLEDVARYAAGYAGDRMLANAWDRIADLIMSTGDARARAAARRVAEHKPGSSSWWHAVRAVLAVTEEARRGRAGHQ